MSMKRSRVWMEVKQRVKVYHSPSLYLVLPFDISLLLPLSLSAITLINESILMYTTPSSALKVVPSETLSPRVWRWVCVCERYLGEAMYSMIQEGKWSEIMLYLNWLLGNCFKCLLCRQIVQNKDIFLLSIILL